MKRVNKKPKYMTDVPMHYCPGCGHSITHRLIAEVLEENNWGEIAIGVPPAGCAVLAYFYIDIDMCEAAHGRGAAVATGIKRVQPQCLVFTYQGDGDLAAIGTAETLHAANRGENITSIFINNAVYGMTGGQMAPTTITDMITTTTPFGRNPSRDGHPVDMSSIVSRLPGSVYVERVAVNNYNNIRRAKKAIQKAFRLQMEGRGFTMVEVLSQCPTNWKMKPVDACKWIEEVMTKHYPLGVLVDRTEGKE